MSIVKFNVLSVPERAGGTLEERFARRAGLVETAEGFEEFQLLRPVEGTDKYIVYTRWRDEESFQKWVSSQAFAQGHASAAKDTERAGGGHGAPVSTDSEVWGFEVVQHVTSQR